MRLRCGDAKEAHADLCMVHAWPPHTCTHALLQIQAELGDGHINLVSCQVYSLPDLPAHLLLFADASRSRNMQEVMLTKTHLAIVMEYASGGNLTAYVTEKWDTSEERNGLFLTEDEARYFFRVRILHAGASVHARVHRETIASPCGGKHACMRSCTGSP